MALESAKAKLEGKFAFENLPADRSDALWDKIEASFKLTLEELSTLKNERCKPQDDGLKRRLAQVESEVGLLRHPALSLFQAHSGCGSSKLDDETKKRVKIRFTSRCVICGTQDNVTVAHIVPRRNEAYEEFKWGQHAIATLNPPHFTTPFDFGSERNLIVLCGTKDKKGTCHWAFDNHFVGILYNPFTKLYDIHWFDTTFIRPEVAALLVLPQIPGFRPYTRALAYHALTGINRSGDNRLYDLVWPAIISMAEENKAPSEHFDNSNIGSDIGSDLHSNVGSELAEHQAAAEDSANQVQSDAASSAT